MRRIAGLCRVVFILRPSQRLWFLVNRQARQEQRICSLESVRRVASEGWTAWKACGKDGWAQVDPAPSENSHDGMSLRFVADYRMPAVSTRLCAGTHSDTMSIHAKALEAGTHAREVQ